MRVRELLTSNVRSCRMDSDLAAVATTLWDHDCGVVPIVNDESSKSSLSPSIVSSSG